MTRSRNDHSSDVLELGCGLTTDVFFDAYRRQVSVQWIWAVPTDRFVRGQHDEAAVLRALADEAHRLGFRPQTTASTHRVLSNGFSHEPGCPFALDACVGEHLVVTGAGRLRHEPSMSAAKALEHLVSHSSHAVA